MIELILRINNPLELDQLLPILKQLKIKYQSRSVKSPKKNGSKKDAVLAKIKAGAFNVPNLDTFMHDFENSRQDKPLVGRI